MNKDWLKMVGIGISYNWYWTGDKQRGISYKDCIFCTTWKFPITHMSDMMKDQRLCKSIMVYQNNALLHQRRFLQSVSSMFIARKTSLKAK